LAIYNDHLAIENCALKDPCMVEKPLAVRLGARQKNGGAGQKTIKSNLLTKLWKTSWYPTKVKAYELLQKGAIGDLLGRR